MLTAKMQDMLKNASARALATNGPHGVNVVPVSVIEVTGTEIRLFDFFMSKTVENLKANNTVALSVWSGLSGIQVKAVATYEGDGELFLAAKQAMKEQFPTRTLRGLIRLQPTYVYDISAGGEAGRLLKSPADF